MGRYDDDVLIWSEHQGALLRQLAAGEMVNNAEFDWPNIAEEIESVGRSERAALASHIRTVLVHLIKLGVSPAAEPRANWIESVINARAAIEDVLEASPSLRPTLSAVLARQPPHAQRLVVAALAAHGETPRIPPEQLQYSEDQVLGTWLPDAPTS
jgi:Domain of unknown function DUF29